ncbi:restriction endonuclease subunit S [Shewanella oncorhynchi]|uniref:restriction endonuclease subunit S n=1 Tax=Shewanella oncorhynchi TaxID=2726434 RepID=UPI00374673C5
MEQVLYPLPEGWKWRRIEEVFTITSGKNLTKKDMQDEGKFPVYGGNGIAGRHNDFNLGGSNIIIGRVGALCGNVRLVNGDIWVTDNAFFIKEYKEDILKEYLAKILAVLNLGETANKAAQPVISYKGIKDLAIPYPPLDEQKRIVEKLDALLTRIDTAIEYLHESVTLADALYASSLDQLFEQIYLDYATRPLSTLASKIGSGATPNGGQNAYKESGISLIRSLNVYDSEFKPGGLAFIDDVQAEKLSNVVVEEGDVLLNITGASIARCCVAPVEFLPARVNQHVCIIRPNEELNSTYLNYLLISPKFKAALLFQGAGGATRQALTKVMVSNLDIPLPPLEVQAKLVDKVNRLSKKNRALKEQVNSKVSDFIILKASILDSAFKGEL